MLDSLPPASAEEVDITSEMLRLQQAYLEAGVVTSRSAEDAMHVAAATVSGADAIVSWNFRHIVNIQKALAFNGVNMIQGYRPIQIISPMEA